MKNAIKRRILSTSLVALLVLLCFSPASNEHLTSTTENMCEEQHDYNYPTYNNTFQTGTRSNHTFTTWVIEEDTKIEGENIYVDGDMIILGANLILSNLSITTEGRIKILNNNSNTSSLNTYNTTLYSHGGIYSEGEMEIFSSTIYVGGDFIGKAGRINIENSRIHLSSGPYSRYTFESVETTLQRKNSLLNRISPMSSLPDTLLYGNVTYPNGSLALYYTVEVANNRTGEVLSRTTGNDGKYRTYLKEFSQGVDFGDSFTVTSVYNGISSENYTTIPNHVVSTHPMHLQLYQSCVRVEIYNNCNIVNSTLSSNTAQNYLMRWHPESSGKIYNSTVSRCGNPIGGGMVVKTSNLSIERSTFSHNPFGILVESGEQKVENSTFMNSTWNDAVVTEGGMLRVVNSTMDREKIAVENESIIIVGAYFHVLVENASGALPGTEIMFRDILQNTSATHTGEDGWSRWNFLTEYVFDSDGCTYLGPYNITIFKEDYVTIWLEEGAVKSKMIQLLLELIEPLEGTMRLAEGANYISLPGNATGWNANTVAQGIEENTSYEVYTISYWGPMGWVTYTHRDYAGNILQSSNFSIETGMGLLVHTLENASQMRNRRWRHFVEPLETPQAISLRPGLNLVGIPYSNSTTNASDIETQMNQQNDGGFIQTSRWTGSTWEVYNSGGDGVNFLIEDPNNYSQGNPESFFINVDKYSTWTPD